MVNLETLESQLFGNSFKGNNWCTSLLQKKYSEFIRPCRMPLADLSLSWAHRIFWFYHVAAQMLQPVHDYLLLLMYNKIHHVCKDFEHHHVLLCTEIVNILGSEWGLLFFSWSVSLGYLFVLLTNPAIMILLLEL